MKRRVTGYEYRSNNSCQRTVARLECGHERVFEYGYYPAEAVCWDCGKEKTMAELIQGVCKDCGNGTLNNELNPAFDLRSDEASEGQEFLVCNRCGSTHLDILGVAS